MSRRILVAVPIAVFLLLTAAFAVPILTGSDPSAVPYARMDEPAPAIELPPLHDGAPGFDTDLFTGEVVLLNVFASWCAPCLVEHPVLTRLAEEEDIPLYGIAYRDAPADTRAWLARHGDAYTAIGVDEDGRAGVEWGVHGVPETFVIDAEGRIRHRHTGAVTAEVARDTLVPLVRALQDGGVETRVSDAGEMAP
ncbi:DsbE family thiol:disulfide interchange protein [Fodinicurvata sp. EGI_FJ10296]|uniref:DsbE family thiol:disulfide interchange protein n=1 Tax=Fodinicurvata sp. EGI_FJ10296 TaxID=3231908 RepID=UPI003454C965